MIPGNRMGWRVYSRYKGTNQLKAGSQKMNPEPQSCLLASAMEYGLNPPLTLAFSSDYTALGELAHSCTRAHSEGYP